MPFVRPQGLFPPRSSSTVRSGMSVRPTCPTSQVGHEALRWSVRPVRPSEAFPPSDLGALRPTCSGGLKAIKSTTCPTCPTKTQQFLIRRKTSHTDQGRIGGSVFSRIMILEKGRSGRTKEHKLLKTLSFFRPTCSVLQHSRSDRSDVRACCWSTMGDRWAMRTKPLTGLAPSLIRAAVSQLILARDA